MPQDINLDMEYTDLSDLRSPNSPWHCSGMDARDGPIQADFACDILIVGGGVTGAFLAEHLSAQGRDVVVIDRELPGSGSTSASTAMLLWEIDTPLTRLTDYYGFETAARVYGISLHAVAGLSERVRRLRLRCNFARRLSLYLAAGEAGSRDVHDEFKWRQRANLPGAFLARDTLQRDYGFDRAAAIVSPGAAEADPLCLTLALLKTAKQRGARILDADAVAFEPGTQRMSVGLASGRQIEARHVILATGYVMPDFMHSDNHSLSTSWAVATQPQAVTALWRDRPLIWEASENYLYARTTKDRRMIIGGEDEVCTPDERERAIPRKSQILQRKLSALWPAANGTLSTRWAGVFGKTKDGLPLIGAVPGHKHLYAAYGYGGNGITFSFLAAHILASMVNKDMRPWFKHFALDRTQP